MATSSIYTPQFGPIAGPATSAASTARANTPAADAALRASVSDILGLDKEAFTDKTAATAAGIQTTGYGKDADAYGKAADIAGGNAQLEEAAGAVQEYQQQREINATIGTQRADVAAAGFKESGSNVDLLRSSLQQGYLTTQLTRTQTNLTEGGYLEQQQAGLAEQQGARTASDAAAAARDAYTSAGSLATANAANETAALNSYITATGGVLTPDEKLATDTLNADPLQATKLDTAGSPTNLNPDTASAGYGNLQPTFFGATAATQTAAATKPGAAPALTTTNSGRAGFGGDTENFTGETFN